MLAAAENGNEISIAADIAVTTTFRFVRDSKVFCTITQLHLSYSYQSIVYQIRPIVFMYRLNEKSRRKEGLWNLRVILGFLYELADLFERIVSVVMSGWAGLSGWDMSG